MPKIKWPTQKYILEQADKSELAALECSALIYKLKMQATPKEAENYSGPGWCAICIRNEDCCQCLLYKINETAYGCCNGIYGKWYNADTNPEKADLARQIYEFIQGKIKELKCQTLGKS